MSPRFRRYVVGATLIAAVAGVAAALVASPASAVRPGVFPPPPGGIISCQNSGKTIVGLELVGTQACLSFQSAFYGYYPNAGSNCAAAGYNAMVYNYNNVLRFQNRWCEDGQWHWSSAWGSNEGRYSEMQIYDVNTNWEIIQYRK